MRERDWLDVLVVPRCRSGVWRYHCRGTTAIISTGITSCNGSRGSALLLLLTLSLSLDSIDHSLDECDALVVLVVSPCEYKRRWILDTVPHPQVSTRSTR